MYKIIGADHREYGPATADEIRMWVREGRANGQTLIQAEGATEWKPLASFPELASALPTGLAAPAAAPTPPLTAEDLAARDYDLDMFDCIRRGWNLVIANFWPVIGATILVAIANGVANQIIQLAARPAFTDLEQQQFNAGDGVILVVVTVLSSALGSVFFGGLYHYLLKLVRGQPAEIGDAFYGFTNAFVPLAVQGLVLSLLACVGFACCIIPGIYLTIAWAFSIPLLVDRKMPFWEAMELSRKVVSRHWFLILGFMLVNGLFAASGIIACCVGMFVTAPMALVSLLYAYEDIFGARNTGSH